MPSPVRIAVVLVIDALALLALAFVLPGFGLATVWSALTLAAVIGVLNAFVWPLLAGSRCRSRS